MMDTMFKALQELIKEPLRSSGGVKTDDSILLIYPPDKELDFREYLLDTFVPAIETQKVVFRLLDLTGFLFAGMSDDAVASLQEEEFNDYRWMQQGLSKRAEAALQTRIEDVAREVPGGNIIIYTTIALFPLVRYGEILRGLRDLSVRIILAFPGEERGGKLHFMNQPDGGNYLAIKLFWR
jgi:hypothetical protein